VPDQLELRPVQAFGRRRCVQQGGRVRVHVLGGRLEK
jgi:hypothetical protein